jgi:DNA-binding response OmpR family regulator
MSERRPRRVLLLDPDERFAKLLESYLDGHGWQVTWMDDGRRALAQLEQVAPDAVLMELDLPHVDALELVEAFGKHRTSPPIVVCTRAPRVRSWTKKTLGELGIEAALCRPVRLANIAEALDDVVESRKSREVAAKHAAANGNGAGADAKAKAAALAIAQRARRIPPRIASK